MPTSELWTEDELRACVTAYGKLWREQQRGQDPAKRSMLDGLLKGVLSARTKGAVEYRMANISAIVTAHGGAFVRGYVPAKNVGPTNTSRIERMLRDEGLI